VAPPRWFRPIRWFQRVLLGAMMTVVAVVVERRLRRALRQGGASVTPAAEDAARGDADLGTGFDEEGPA
jgi:hypothetical protein